jgi:seryl-tRNA synthetase
MIPLNTIRTETERVKNGLAKKHFPNVDLVDEIIMLDNQRRSLQTSRDDLQNKMNELSRQIGIFIKNKNFDEANKIKDETASIKIEIQEKEVILKEIESKKNNNLVLLPNIPHESVPEGKTADDNVNSKKWWCHPNFDFTALPHWD